MHAFLDVNYTLKQVKVWGLCAGSGFMKIQADIYHSEWINEDFNPINFVIGTGQET